MDFSKYITAYITVLVAIGGYFLGMYSRKIQVNGPRNKFEEAISVFNNGKFMISVVATLAVIAVVKMIAKLVWNITLPF